MIRAPHVTPDHMRVVLGHFCSGVTVITSIDDGGPVGFTCQSFSSLSLDPPLVSFSPARTSTTWPRIRSVGTFAINVLAAHQDALSDGFARSGADKFAGVAWKVGLVGAPLLQGAVAWAECRLWAEYDGGDHTIVAAEVLGLEANPAAAPLAFFQGRYHLVNPPPGGPTTAAEEFGRDERKTGSPAEWDRRSRRSRSPQPGEEVASAESQGSTQSLSKGG